MRQHERYRRLTARRSHREWSVCGPPLRQASAREHRSLGGWDETQSEGLRDEARQLSSVVNERGNCERDMRRPVECKARAARRARQVRGIRGTRERVAG